MRQLQVAACVLVIYCGCVDYGICNEGLYSGWSVLICRDSNTAPLARPCQPTVSYGNTMVLLKNSIMWLIARLTQSATTGSVRSPRLKKPCSHGALYSSNWV